MQHLQPFALFEARASGIITQEQEDFLNRYTQGTWLLNPATGLMDVQGSFDCSRRRLPSLAGIQFGTVTGNFNCIYNQLTSLVGAPQKVEGGFYCYFNLLTSLVGSPQTVTGNFLCANNLLTNLVGAPQKVGDSFSCQDNQLTSLVGAPQTRTKNFYCSFNLLTNLAGAPQTVGGDFQCNHNQLTSLEGAPESVGEDFDCYFNQLTSLEGAPQTVGGRFWCDAFRLKPGQWNLAGWLQVLREGDPADRRLVLTLFAFDAQFWLNRLKGDLKQDGQTLLQLADLWGREGWKEVQAQLQQKLEPAQLRVIQALKGKLPYVDPWQDFKL